MYITMPYGNKHYIQKAIYQSLGKILTVHLLYISCLCLLQVCHLESTDHHDDANVVNGGGGSTYISTQLQHFDISMYIAT